VLPEKSLLFNRIVMNLIWQKQNWMTVFASLLYQLFPSNVDEIGVWSLQG